jgi:diguanylate cyclase (GGDEF)-like protein
MDTDIELPVAATRHREHQLIERLLKRSGFRLRFPGRLEGAYRQYRDANAASLFRTSVIYIAYVYAGIGVMAALLAGYQQLGLWPLTFSSFGLLLLLGWVISFTPFFHRHYQAVTGVLATLAVMVAVSHPALIGNEAMRVLIHIGTVYVMVIIYLALNLRFVSASLAGWGGGLGALGLQMLWGVQPEWGMVAPTYGGASLLGMLLCYRDEYQSRRMFLQGRLLQQEKQRIQQLADRLETLSLVDSLTGLANRRAFDQVFEREWRRARRECHAIALIFVDVDNFKAYNDFYGHQQGDDCLRELARIMTQHSERASDFAARYGGEEFVLLYPGLGVDDARALAQRILTAVRESAMPHARSSVAEYVTLSLGVAVREANDPEYSDRADLLRRADEAVYRAKRNGRNRFEVL